jgi:hypothetical protein
MIIDVQCTKPECGKVQEDVFLRPSDAPLPVCECGAPTERRWSLSRGGSNTSANHASVFFKFNYMGPSE